jgi:hypothetical protein
MVPAFLTREYKSANSFLLSSTVCPLYDAEAWFLLRRRPSDSNISFDSTPEYSP